MGRIMNKPYVETSFMDRRNPKHFSAYVYLEDGHLFRVFEFKTKQELFDFCEGFITAESKKC